MLLFQRQLSRLDVLLKSVIQAPKRISRRSSATLTAASQPVLSSAEFLEDRTLLAAPHPVDLGTLDGANGFRIEGIDTDDASGRSVSSAGDINGDGFDDLVISAYRADPGGNSESGETYVVFGSPSSIGSTLELSTLDGTIGFRINGINADDQSGWSVSDAGDLNGDGLDDLVIAAREAGDAGETYVVFGRSTSFSSAIDLSTLDGISGFVIEGIDSNDFSGNSVSSAGDVNGDGFDDLIIGALLADPDGTQNAGESYLVFGRSSGFTNSMALDDLDGTTGFKIEGIDPRDLSGVSVSGAGDFNGDGFDDLVIGAVEADPGGKIEAGESYVVFGKASSFDATIELSSLDGTVGFRLDGVDPSDRSGNSVSSAGDVNGDGFDDLIIGAYFADPSGDGSGESYVVFGRSGNPGSAIDLGTLDSTNGFRIEGIATGDLSGSSVSAAGDVNADGFDDVIIGAAVARDVAGESYVLFGKSGGFATSVELETLDGTDGFRLDGIDGGDQSGFSVSGAGDVNGDGFDDLVIGAFRAAYETGESYVVFGENFIGGVETQVGTDVANILFANQGQSTTDILVGGLGNDTLMSDGGADVLYGGEGNDTLTIPDADFGNTRRLVGGSGSDTLRLNGSGIDLDLTSIHDNRIVDVEFIDLTGSGNNSLVLDFQEVVNISRTSNTLIIMRDAGDTVFIGAGWTQGVNQTIDAVSYEVFTQGAAVLKVQREINHDFAITVPESGLLASESGTTDSFDVVLIAEPMSDVVLTITSTDETEVAVSPSTLIFTPDNWDTPQTVTVSAVDDSVRDGMQTVEVTVSVDENASDDNFDHVSDQTVLVTTKDDNFIGISLDGDGSLVISDDSTAGLAEDLTLLVVSDELLIFDSDNVLVTSVGTQASDSEVRVPLSSITGNKVVVNHNRGSDRLNAASLGATLRLEAAGGPGDDTITGSPGADTLSGDSGDDSLVGGGSDDILLGGFGDDELDGGTGDDTLMITSAGRLAITTNQTLGEGTDSFTGIEKAVLEGGDTNDRLDATQAIIPVTLFGHAGNDTLLGGAAIDSLDGGAGADFGEVRGSDIVLTDAAIIGTPDTLNSLEGLLLIASSRGSSIDASGYTLSPVTIVGSSGDDTLTGGSDADLVIAGAGNDSVDGGGGADFILGGQGNDTINGDAGSDTILGGGGSDAIDGGTNDDVLIGGHRNDTIRGDSGTDFIFGGVGRDSIDGNDDNDTLFGGTGRDNIAGGLGIDQLNGMERDDSFNQVVGQDTLIGGQRPASRKFVLRQPEKAGFTAAPILQPALKESQVSDESGRIVEAFSEPLLQQLLEL